jgi:hypothetical protein
MENPFKGSSEGNEKSKGQSVIPQTNPREVPKKEKDDEGTPGTIGIGTPVTPEEFEILKKEAGAETPIDPEEF